MPRLRCPAILCLFAFCGFLRSEDNPLRIELVSEVKQISPGVPFHVGLHLQHQPGDHTYWKFPGIVGVPTDMKWNLPAGFKAGPIEWPEPQRVYMFQIKAQGYEGDVLLPVRITPPKDLSRGARVVLKGQASWMCCGRSCNPGFKNLSLELEVGAAGAAPVFDERWHERFAKAHSSVPQRLAGWKVEATRDDETIRLQLTALNPQSRERAGAIKEMIFFTEDGLINADKQQVFARPAPDKLSLTLAVSEYATNPNEKVLRGVLQTPQGWSPDGTIRSVNIRAGIGMATSNGAP